MPQFKLINRIAPIAEQNGDSTAYKFWRRLDSTQRTAYGLYDMPLRIPDGDTLVKICLAYNCKPGDVLVLARNYETAERFSEAKTFLISTRPPIACYVYSCKQGENGIVLSSPAGGVIFPESFILGMTQDRLTAFIQENIGDYTNPDLFESLVKISKKQSA